MSDSRVLIDAAALDDAAVVRMGEDRALVATVDFFAPIVDDPYSFGVIAAANAWSDVYAMGAQPLFALNLVAWPRRPGVLELLGEALQGMAETTERAGAFVLGGHSIDDPEPKLGLVAVGEVAPGRIVRNSGARPGDELVLTKPLGTGVLSTALKQDRLPDATAKELVRVMSELNAGAAAAMSDHADAVHAATDVTGFGLVGHLKNILAASGCGAKLQNAMLPVLPGTRELVEEGAIPGGTERNLAAAEEFTRWRPDIPRVDQVIAADAQTSGGLLIAVAPESLPALLESLTANQTPAAAHIGTVTESAEPLIQVE